ncbi:ecdysone 20-monooxygenase [Condylostylus longicornis]|uniref:ecdysone 20-monooxygenase n=1 Tax=Condylostylus longicornis TaxID=2530218 RepID=UPI00244E305D|nr:ecdysone 20-monooxygenase [Condylostylus longicornis]XP_055376932.1 ecdysone 20-monooxygenase [Condylostylus longicornis]XP_055376933.1 ecdysone 20-monooxygenase [Condylostylus longicornis]
MSIILCVLLVFLFVVYCKWILQVYMLKFLKQKRERKKSIWDIPGPMILPFFGTKWIFLWKYKISKLHEAYFDFNKQYGQIALEVTPFGTPVIHIFDKDDIEKVLRYPSKYPFRPPTEIVMYYRQSRPDRYCSIGIVNEQGEKWHNLRNKLTPHITSPKIIQTFLPVLNSISDDFIQLLKTERDHKTFLLKDFNDIANLMGLEAICAFVLGRRMGFLTNLENQPKEINDLAMAVKQLFVSQRDSYFGMGLWKYFPTKTYQNFEFSEDTIYSVISNLVNKSLDDEQLECDSEDIKSVYINILRTEDLDIKEKKSAIIDFIAAGIETMANTLIFMLYHITNHSDACERIIKEIKQFKSSSVLEIDLNKATYTKACLKEVYRIQPTAFCLARVLEENMFLSGYYIPSGSVILCQNMIACHNDVYFSDAKKFIPDRWLDETKSEYQMMNSTIIAPFGAGKRMCPGKRFVEMEILILVAKLLINFDIHFENELETEFEFLLVPKTPIDLILKDRELN